MGSLEDNLFYALMGKSNLMLYPYITLWPEWACEITNGYGMLIPGKRDDFLDIFTLFDYHIAMTTMNANATFNQFMGLAQQDMSFAMVQSAKTVGKGVAWLFAAPFFFIAYAILAQFVPFIFKKHLSVILPALPYLKDRKLFSMLQDIFSLYYYAMKGYRPVSLFKGKIDAIVDELDEQLDSISFGAT